MATPSRFLRRRRRQPKGGGVPQSTFFRPASRDTGQVESSSTFSTPDARRFIQTKLTVSQPGDAHEQQADAMAEHVVQRRGKPDDEALQRQATKDDNKAIQRMADKDERVHKKDREEDKNKVRKIVAAHPHKRKHKHEKYPNEQHRDDDKRHPVQMQTAKPTKAPVASAAVSQQLQGTKGQGSGLNPTVQTEMSQAFGYDFKNVRIHTTAQAEQMNQDLNAFAFTHGQDIYFDIGQYNPDTTDGKRLLAHELTHVVQQNTTLPFIDTTELAHT